MHQDAGSLEAPSCLPTHSCWWMRPRCSLGAWLRTALATSECAPRRAAAVMLDIVAHGSITGASASASGPAVYAWEGWLEVIGRRGQLELHRSLTIK